jgi:Tfp pilus assembly protein PilO
MMGLWYELAWSAQGQAVATAHSSEQTATNALLTAEQRLGHLKHLSVKSGALDAAGAKLAAAVPSQDDLDGLLLELNGDAAAAGVTVKTLGATQPAVGASAATPIPLQLTVSGGYFAIQHFLDLLRDGQRLVVVDTLSLASETAPSNGAVASGQGTDLTANIAGRVFMAKGSSSLSPSPLPVSRSVTGTGVLETPINSARTAASNASAAAKATDVTTGATP